MTLDEARAHIGAGVVYHSGHGMSEDGENRARLRPACLRALRGRPHTESHPTRLSDAAGAAHPNRIPVLRRRTLIMTRHATTEDLRAAIEAAIPAMTSEQARRARSLLVTLTPAMEEPEWPGAPVIAGCNPSSAVPILHIRRLNCGPDSEWECEYCTGAWNLLAFPRPLTAEEYAEHRIPMPCTHTTAEETA